jgi:hypothetical protein
MMTTADLAPGEEFASSDVLSERHALPRREFERCVEGAFYSSVRARRVDGAKTWSVVDVARELDAIRLAIDARQKRSAANVAKQKAEHAAAVAAREARHAEQLARAKASKTRPPAARERRPPAVPEVYVRRRAT